MSVKYNINNDTTSRENDYFVNEEDLEEEYISDITTVKDFIPSNISYQNDQGISYLEEEETRDPLELPTADTPSTSNISRLVDPASTSKTSNNEQLTPFQKTILKHIVSMETRLERIEIKIDKSTKEKKMELITTLAGFPVSSLEELRQVNKRLGESAEFQTKLVSNWHNYYYYDEQIT